MARTLNEWRDIVGAWAKEKGWDELPPRTVGDDIALMHSELSEALEEFRTHGDPGKIWFNHDRTVTLADGDLAPKPEGVPVELVDCMYRIFHFSAKYNIDLDGCMEMKHKYNTARPHRHGGKNL